MLVGDHVCPICNPNVQKCGNPHGEYIDDRLQSVCHKQFWHFGVAFEIPSALEPELVFCHLSPVDIADRQKTAA